MQITKDRIKENVEMLFKWVTVSKKQKQKIVWETHGSNKGKK